MTADIVPLQNRGIDQVYALNTVNLPQARRDRVYVLPGAARQTTKIYHILSHTIPRVTPMPDEITREEMDAKLREAAAKTDVRFAEMLGEVRLISSDLKGEMGKINARLDSVRQG